MRGLAGNVEDWCLDLDKGMGILRGGAWDSGRRGARLAYRVTSRTTARYGSRGFRGAYPVS